MTASPVKCYGAPLLLCGDLVAACRLAVEYECQGVEIHVRRAEDLDATALMHLLADYGLRVPTLGTGMAAADGLSFASPHSAVRAQTVERVCGHIALAAQIGSAVTIGILSGKLGGGTAEEILRRRSEALDCLRQVCCFAQELGVTILLEPLNRYECDYINTLADGIHIADEIGAPNLRLLADTFHMNIEEVDPCESVMHAGAVLAHFHLADTNRQAPGHGHLDVARILDALSTLDYQGYVSFEVLPVPDPKTAVHDAVNALRAPRRGKATGG